MFMFPCPDCLVSVRAHVCAVGGDGGGKGRGEGVGVEDCGDQQRGSSAMRQETHKLLCT